MQDIKVLSVRQPYAWLIVHGFKDVENRARRSNYTGPLYIHAGKTRARAFELIVDLVQTEGGIMIPVAELPYGGIVGKVIMEACVTDHPSDWNWGEDDFQYVLSNAQPLANMIPMNGKLGIFNATIDPALLNFIEPEANSYEWIDDDE